MKEFEKEAVSIAAKLMLAAARTAPKTKGIDSIVTRIVNDEEKERIALEMERIAGERRVGFFERDAKNLRKSSAVVLIGAKTSEPVGLNCGACGYDNCEEFKGVKREEGQDYVGPACIFKVMDLGIALGSAVKIASDLAVDNRMMYSVGSAARKLGLIDADIVIGIPLSVSGKNIYFDRK
jgi:uncharacterized ferredoxin-like protein